MQNKTNRLRNMFFSCGLICCVTFACLLPGNAFSSTRTLRGERLARAFNLKKGEEVSIRGTTLQIKVLGIEDSRCPTRVTCIWAGKGDILLQASLKGKSIENFTLTTTRTGAPDRHQFRGYQISLMALNPYPESGTRIEPDQYLVTLLISRTAKK